MPALYELRVRGELDGAWADWFDGWTLAPSGDGDTLLTGPVPDQAALQGLLLKITQSGLALISINPVSSL